MGLLPFKDEAKDIGYEVNPKHESFRKYSKNLDQNANRISQQRMSIVANLSPQQQTTIKEENSENEISKSSEFDINNSYTSSSFSESAGGISYSNPKMKRTFNSGQRLLEEEEGKVFPPIMFRKNSSGRFSQSHNTTKEIIQNIDTSRNISNSNSNEKMREKSVKVRNPKKSMSEKLLGVSKSSMKEHRRKTHHSPQQKRYKKRIKSEYFSNKPQDGGISSLILEKNQEDSGNNQSTWWKRHSQYSGKKMKTEFRHMQNMQKGIENKVDESGNKLAELSQYICGLEKKLDKLGNSMNPPKGGSLRVQTTSVHPSIKWISQMKPNLK